MTVNASSSEAFKTLVTRLRSKDGKDDLDLVDILSLAELMISTMQGFFSTVDGRIYAEFRNIAEQINQTKQEVADLQPREIEAQRIPLAGKELDAIVRQTEDATNTIMENAETIMGADPSDFTAYRQTVDTAVMQIFEACAFQDITGQRISKVVATLKHIEERIASVTAPEGEEGNETASKPKEPAKEKDPLLNGPALDGQGIDQNDVDALFSQEDKEVDQGDIDALFG